MDTSGFGGSFAPLRGVVLSVDKLYAKKVMENSRSMPARLNAGLERETEDILETKQSADHLAEVMEALLAETYDELEADLQKKAEGLNHQATTTL